MTLLYRSTRQLSLTHEGRLLHENIENMLEAAENGLDAVNPMSKEPRGVLRLTVPAFVTQTGLMESFAKFSLAFPKIDLNIDFADYPRNLIKDGFDVAIRAGWLTDAEFMSRSIGHEDRLMVASPEYFASMAPPLHPKDLEAWNWIRFSMRPNQTELTSSKGEVVLITGKSHLSVNSANALYEFSVRGLGLTALPEHLACRGIDRGELVHVLSDWSLQPLGLHIVWPDKSRRENLTMIFVRFLSETNSKS